MTDIAALSPISASYTQSALPTAMTNPVTVSTNKPVNNDTTPNISVNINVEKPTPVNEIPVEAIKALYFPQFKIPEEDSTDSAKYMSYRD